MSRKHQCNALTGSWCRDLDADLNVTKNWGADILISLNESEEFDTFCVNHLPERAKSMGIEWMHLPIQDRWIPNIKFEDTWDCQGHLIREVNQSGSNIKIHCLGGLGRTGLVAARLLVELCISNDKAIAMVREASSGSIELHKQELYIEIIASFDKN